MIIPIEVSARHVHLSADAVETLFGKDYSLTIQKNLSQPGQFACKERVDIIGPRAELKNVAVLGPVRKNTQIEISVTDSIKIGIKCMIRESGDLKGTPGCILRGPEGEYSVDSGLIIAKRHVHMTPSDAVKFSVYNGQTAKVKIQSHERSLIYNDVVMRVSEDFALSMHLDTDEANAANLEAGVSGELIL